MKKYKNSPVFVTGIERSGNSIIGRIIKMGGAWTGETTPMCENIKLNELYLNHYRNIVGDYSHIPLGQYPLPDVEAMLIPANWKAKIEDCIGKQGYDEQRLWMYKNPKLCHTWPMWHYAYPDAKWIIVRRRSADIIQSCIKTAYMIGYEKEEVLRQIGVETERDGWLWWIHEHEKRFVEMIETGLDCKVIWPERMVEGNYHQIYEMLEWLGLRWSDEIVTKIDPLLKKSRR